MLCAYVRDAYRAVIAEVVGDQVFNKCLDSVKLVLK